MATNASAQQDTLHPQPTQRQTSLLNVQTLMNAPVKTAVMLMPHAAIMQAVTIALVTLATINLDLDTPEECHNINECTVPSHDCDENATCGDTIGSYECQCNAGYNGDGAAGTCADIDECADGSHTCDENATCTNNDGGFTCACNAGWNTSGNGQAGTCHNVNECSEAVKSHTCGENSKCVDNPGSYDCECLPSFHMAEGACVDDDECANNSNGCHEGRSVCTNEAKTYTMEWVSGVAQYTLNGRGFSCACNVGYSDDNLDGTACSDVD